MIFVCGAISFAAVWAMKDYTGADIHDEYDAGVAGSSPLGAY